VNKKFIQVFEPQKPENGPSITYSTPQGRKSFSLPRPKANSKTTPVAIESFAIDTEIYHQRMEMVEALINKQKDQGR
tara:strand:- start:21 stop:251 length:231 start_codon:yes stop_codon:yes gene_type:complete